MPSGKDATADELAMVSPSGSVSRKVTPVDRVGDLVVVDDPFEPGFAVVAAASGRAVTADRYTDVSSAVDVAARLDELADWSQTADRDLRKQLTSDPKLEAKVRKIAAEPADLLPPRVPNYPQASRTGASYEQGYDERRRAKKP